jgi:hypothetical protein
MSTTYRVRDWALLFETAETRKLKHLTWVPIPTKHDGKGYRRLMKAGPLNYAAWLLIVQVASKCPQRGLLADQDGPLEVQDLAIKTDFPAKAFAAAIPHLLEIGWLEALDKEGSLLMPPGTPADPPGAPADSAGRMEGNGREENRREGQRPKTSDAHFDAWYEAYFRKEKRQEAEAAWKKLTEPQKNKAVVVVSAWCRWKGKADNRKFWPLPASWLNGHRFDDEIPPDPRDLCSRCGKEPRLPGSDMGEKCWKELGIGG